MINQPSITRQTRKNNTLARCAERAILRATDRRSFRSEDNVFQSNEKESGAKPGTRAHRQGKIRFAWARTAGFIFWFLLLLGAVWPRSVAAGVVPSTTTPPTNQAVTVGGTVNLSILAAGTAPLSYQWFENGGAVLGATNSTLTFANAGVTNSGVYYVVWHDHQLAGHSSSRRSSTDGLGLQ